jgi:hypothetical protein
MKFELNAVTHRQPNEVQPMIARSSGNATMAVCQFDSISALPEDLDDRSKRLKLVPAGHGAIVNAGKGSRKRRKRRK